MPDALEIINVKFLMDRTDGNSDIVIGIIDGPVETSHPDLEKAKIRRLSNSDNSCKLKSSLACQHGTFIAGILAAQRSSRAPAICPGCNIVVRQIFCEDVGDGQCPIVTPDHLSAALVETVDAGAKVINMSLGLASTILEDNPSVREAYDYAFHKGTILVGASGNQGHIGHIPLFNHPWIIPVASCNLSGEFTAGSNIGTSVGKRGLMSPGMAITSISAAGGYTEMSGTSIAAPFVTGTIALLWSLFPQASAATIRNAILLSAKRRNSIIPPLLDANASWQKLTNSLEN